jgi:hypothetical protein
MATAVADVWVYLCEAGHLHVTALAAGDLIAGSLVTDAVVADDRIAVFVKEICRDELGRFASCPGASGSSGTTPAVRPGKTQARKVAERQEAVGKAHALVEEIKKSSGPADPDKLKELAGHLGKLTVQQLHALKGQHGLKASAATKAALTAKLLNRFAALAHADRPSDSTHPSEPADPWKGRPEPFTTSTKIDQWGEKNYGQWARSLTDTQKEVVSDYKGVGYAGLNRHLRAGGDPASPEPPSTASAYARRSSVEHTTSNLDAALAKTPTDRDLIVFRGHTSGEVIDKVKGNLGGTFSDKAYQSTSLSQEVATKFLYNVSKKVPAMTWEVHVPKGSRGAYLSTNAAGSSGNEHEFLLPRDSKFRILEVAHHHGTNRYHVKARLEQ